MRKKKAVGEMSGPAYKITAAVLLLLFITVSVPRILRAENINTESVKAIQRKTEQITGLNVVDVPQSKNLSLREVTAVSNTDPMYWMGQMHGGDTNRAMVWFGNYWQTYDGASKSPILWRTLRSDGVGNYAGAVTLLSEYALNDIWFDQNTSSPNQYWYSKDSSKGSSDLRAWMNGVGTGSMNPDAASRLNSSSYQYNASGGGTGSIKGSFYANAFNTLEKSLITPVSIEVGRGYEGLGPSTEDKIFPLSYEDANSSQYFSGDTDRRCYPTDFLRTGSNTISEQARNGYVEWWLRTPINSYKYPVNYITSYGNIYSSNPDYYCGGRPALLLWPEKIVFTSASSTGGTPVSSKTLTACSGVPGTFNTSYPGGFRIFERGSHPDPDYSLQLRGINGSTSAKVKYVNATPGDYITVFVVNTSNGQKWCGRIGQVAANGDGYADFTIPYGMYPGGLNFRIFAWTEKESSKIAYTPIASVDLDAIPLFPNITKQPSTITGKAGTSTTMTVTATGVSLSYVWYITSNASATGGIKIGSGASLTYKLSSSDNGKYYYCIVKNDLGDSVASSVAPITVYSPPSISTHPSSKAVKQGSTASFTVAGTGGNPTSYNYQWQYSTNSGGSWANVTSAQGSGGTTATFTTVAATTAMNNYQYRCYVGNSQYSGTGGTASNAATLTVYWPPSIKTHPSNVMRFAGNQAVFTAEGEGGNPTGGFTYQWQYRTSGSGTWTNVTTAQGSGGATSTFTTVAVTAVMNGYQYRCCIGNSQYTATSGTASNPATLTARYRIAYNQNYEGAPEVTNEDIVVGKSVTLPKYSRTGYEFRGWATTSTATTANVGAGGASYTPANNITLYAVWKLYTQPVLDSTKPIDRKISEGGSTTFPVGITTAGYPDTYTYQWYYKDGTNTEHLISGATGSSYTLNNAPAGNNGYKYYCKISHAATGSVHTTREAVLTVRGKPENPQIEYPGGGTSFSWSNAAEGQFFIPRKGAEVEGGSFLQYQTEDGDWRTYSGTKLVTITADGVTETDPKEGEQAGILVLQEGQHTVKVRAVNAEDQSLASSGVTITGKLDYTAPKAKLNDSKGTIWDQLQNLITFGKYYKENVVFTIDDIKDDPASGVNIASGVKKTSYYIFEASTEAKEEELASITAENIAEKSASWAWQEYTSGSFTVSPDKKFVVYAKVEDNAGNLHYIGSDGLIADATNPTAETNQNPTGWTNGDVTVTVTASDALSQLEDKPYSYDGGNTFVSTNTNTYGTNGEKTIQVKDKAGNILNKKHTISSIDKQKPVISNTPGIQVNPGWVTAKEDKVTISLPLSAVTDNEVSGDTTANKGKSGIAGVFLIKAENKDDETVADNAIVGTFAESGADDAKVWSLEMTAPSATTSCYIRTKDNAGNWSMAAEAHKAVVQVDTVKPVVGKVSISPDNWTNKTITITASEITTGPSGLDGVYLFKNETDITPSSGYAMTKSEDGKSYSFTIPSDQFTVEEYVGEKTWYIRAFNTAGGISDGKAAVTKYNNTSVSLTAVQEPDKNEDGSLVYALEKSIRITAQDTISGLRKIAYYKKNTEGGAQPEDTDIWPAEGNSESAGSTNEVTVTITGIQENGAYVIKAYDSAGNVTVQEVQVSGIDRAAPDITGFKKHTQTVDGVKKMVVTFKVKDEGSGTGKVVYGTNAELDIATASEAVLGDIDGSEDAGDGYIWYHFTTSYEEAEKNYYVRAKDALGNQSETILAYESKNLIDVSIPAKMMFAVIPELGGDGSKDSRLLAPEYQIKNNSGEAKVQVSLTGFAPVSGGRITLSGSDSISQADQLNLKAGKGTGAFLDGLGEAHSLYGLSQGSGEEMLFGTLKTAGKQGSSGTFSFAGILYDYQKNDKVKQESILRAGYTAGFHFSIELPKK